MKSENLEVWLFQDIRTCDIPGILGRRSRSPAVFSHRTPVRAGPTRSHLIQSCRTTAVRHPEGGVADFKKAVKELLDFGAKRADGLVHTDASGRFLRYQLGDLAELGQCRVGIGGKIVFGSLAAFREFLAEGRRL